MIDMDSRPFVQGLNKAMAHTTQGACLQLQADVRKLFTQGRQALHIPQILNAITQGLYSLMRSPEMRRDRLHLVLDGIGPDGWLEADHAHTRHYYVGGWTLCGRTMGMFWSEDKTGAKCKVCQRSLEAKIRKGERVAWAGA